MKTKKRLIIFCILILALCGFALPPEINPFDPSLYLNTDIVTDTSHLTHEDFGDNIENGIDWTEFKIELSEQVQTTEYEIEIKQFEDSWITKLFAFLF